MAKCMMHGSEVHIQIPALPHNNVILSKLSFLNLFYYLENKDKTNLQSCCENLILNPLVLEIILRFNKYYFSFPYFVFLVKLFQPQVRTQSLIADDTVKHPGFC